MTSTRAGARRLRAGIAAHWALIRWAKEAGCETLDWGGAVTCYPPHPASPGYGIYDFKRGFSKIKVPMAIIFGDADPLASVDSTRSVYRSAKSEYLLWRPVKGNSHIEVTMGHDVRQICYDIKNLIEYAKVHRNREPSLPRIR